ncbi:MAG: hypothetical protein KKC84_06415, partial [Candidatus Omnitrophica bacterium]|nr:hypothetical protein [Candidatus Omnitrophota bacterium]
QLKKDTALLTSPQTSTGKIYWKRLYEKAGELFGSDTINIPTLTRPWIVPGEVIITETNGSPYIYKATLKVMLEEDYLRFEQGLSPDSSIRIQAKGTVPKDSKIVPVLEDPRFKSLNEYSTQLIRELILPHLVKVVNSSRRYAPLRQVYYSLVLSQWYKTKFRDGSESKMRSVPLIRQRDTSEHDFRTVPELGRELIDSRNLSNLTSKDPWSKETYYQQYKQSFEKGEYDIQESVYTPFGQTIRHYISGGIELIESASSAIAITLPVLPESKYNIAADISTFGSVSFEAPSSPTGPQPQGQSIEGASSPVAQESVPRVFAQVIAEVKAGARSTEACQDYSSKIVRRLRDRGIPAWVYEMEDLGYYYPVAELSGVLYVVDGYPNGAGPGILDLLLIHGGPKDVVASWWNDPDNLSFKRQLYLVTPLGGKIAEFYHGRPLTEEEFTLFNQRLERLWAAAASIEREQRAKNDSRGRVSSPIERASSNELPDNQLGDERVPSEGTSPQRGRLKRTTDPEGMQEFLDRWFAQEQRHYFERAQWDRAIRTNTPGTPGILLVGESPTGQIAGMMYIHKENFGFPWGVQNTYFGDLLEVNPKYEAIGVGKGLIKATIETSIRDPQIEVLLVVHPAEDSEYAPKGKIVRGYFKSLGFSELRFGQTFSAERDEYERYRHMYLSRRDAQLFLEKVGDVQWNKMEGSSSPMEEIVITTQEHIDDIGGIDFTNIPSLALPAFNGEMASSSTIQEYSLSEEWQHVQKMLSAGITPSAQRISDYIQVCRQSQNYNQEIGRILGCIAEIMRVQEDKVLSVDKNLTGVLYALGEKK